MNIVLWVVQIALAVKLVSVALTHGWRKSQTKMDQGMQRIGTKGATVLNTVALCALLVAMGLVVPGATGTQVWLTPLSAALLAVMMILSIGFHIACRETPHVLISLVICALATFVAFGRWLASP